MFATSPLSLAQCLTEHTVRIENAYKADQLSERDSDDSAVLAIHDLPVEVRCEYHITIVFNAESPRIEAKATIIEDNTLQDVRIVASDHDIDLTVDIEKATSLYLAIQAYAEAFTM